MQTTIYIRKDNEDYWNSISDKSAWVNILLAQKTIVSHGLDVKPPKIKYDKPTEVFGKPIHYYPLVEQAIAAFSGSLKQCKDGHAIPKGRDRCLAKGCKYS